MKLSRISFLLLLFIVGANQVASAAQSLPAKVKSYLDKTYVGWKQSVMASDAGCFDDFKKLIVVGDFDGNGKQDYATRIITNAKVTLWRFLSKKETINRTFC